MSDTDHNDDDETRGIWDIQPFKTTVELTEGSIRIREDALHTGRLRVAKATGDITGPPECAWLYLQAEGRDGADVKLTPGQARKLRDALDKCIQQHEDQEADDAE